MLVAALEVDVGRPAQLGPERAAPPRGSSPSRTRRRGCRPRARTPCRRTTGRSARRAGTLRAAARTRRRRRRCRTPPRRGRPAPAVRSASPHAVQSTAGIGTPQARWREMHQSGRFATMLMMRSRPVGGTHRTWLSMASIAASRERRRRRGAGRRSPPSCPSIAMNHCDVARKMTGLWQRQQCGYVCWNGSRCHSRPRSSSACFDVRVGVEHALAAEQLDVSEEVPARSDRRVDLQAVLHAGLEVVAAVARARCGRPRCPARRVT